MSETPEQAPSEPAKTSRLSRDVHRMLLTIQYQRKMAGENISFDEIIKQALTKAGMV